MAAAQMLWVLGATAQAAQPQSFDREASNTRPGSSRVIEEVIVTAQRNEQVLHEVPISMSVVDDAFMQQQGVSDLQGVTAFVPNVTLDISSGAIVPSIRGFRTDAKITKGFEQTVGLTIDEIPYGRSEYFLSALFDLGRVEILRGPQGQLFGANTTVGLMNMVSKDPTDEFSGFVSLDHGELGRQRLEAALSGPVIPDFLNFRVAGLTEEREGHVKNTTAAIVPEAPERLGTRDRQSFRIKLDFPDLLGLRLMLSYQRDDLNVEGATTREFVDIPEEYHDFLREYDPNMEFEPNYVASQDFPSFQSVDIESFVARGSYELGEWGLNGVLGYSKLRAQTQDDGDQGPVPMIDSYFEELGRQTTVELRISSPELQGLLGLDSLFGLSLGSTEFTSGIFYQRRTQGPSIGGTHTNVALLAESIAIGSSPGPFGTIIGGMPKPPDAASGSAAGTEEAATRFEQEGKKSAAFGQMNWRFADRWALIFGLRLDYTTLEAFWDQYAEPDSAVFLTTAFPEFTDADGRNEFNVAPKVGIKYDRTDDVNFYLTWAKNFQAGGFNSFSVNPDRAERRFDPAKVNSWEAGTKMRLLNGSAELNVGLFWQTMVDFQLLTLEPGSVLFTPKVVNVGELRARGVEIDGIWLPTDWLSLRGAIGFNDSEYIKFPFGSCMAGDENSDGDDDPRCDQSGERLTGASKWDISFSPSVRTPLTSIPGIGQILPPFLDGVEFTSTLSAQYFSERYLASSLDPRGRQPSALLIGGSIGFANAKQGWSLHFRGENLTDEYTHNFASGTAGASNSMLLAPNPPRLYYAQVRWSY